MIRKFNEYLLSEMPKHFDIVLELDFMPSWGWSYFNGKDYLCYKFYLREKVDEKFLKTNFKKVMEGYKEND